MKRNLKMMKAILMAAALLSTPALAADQFDLICTGQAKDTMTSRETPIARHYHLDLTTGQYCYNECTVRQLNEVNSSQIVFEETQAQFPRDHNASLDYVSRTTGRWEFFTSYWNGSGRCEVAPFTSFPVPPRQF
jgi:hypothetical protein